MRPASGDAVFAGRDEEGRIIEAGVAVSAEDLDRGRMAYVDFCASCHGLDGDGRGPDAAGMDPPPRDFRPAVLKFAAVRSGELPNDADLRRVIRHGLQGTEMPAWSIDADEITRIVHFLKTFPKPGCPQDEGECLGPWLRKRQDGKPARQTGAPIRAGIDPWAGRPEEAARRGEVLYHETAECTSCHPSYRGEGRPAVPIAAEKNPYGDEITPPDLKKDIPRSIRPEHALSDTYVVIAAGVGGVMPAWADALSDEDLWALAHYVSSLLPRREE